MSGVGETRIPCSKETMEMVKLMKTGGETWDSLLRKMADNYDPSEYDPGEVPDDFEVNIR